MAKIRIERDISTDHWLVVEYIRRGWSVLRRCDDESDAHRYAQSLVYANEQLAREGRCS